MFKRVLLLAVLMAVLVVTPVAAEIVYETVFNVNEPSTGFTNTISLEPYDESYFNLTICRYDWRSTVEIYGSDDRMIHSNTNDLPHTIPIKISRQPYRVTVKSYASGTTYTGYLALGEPWIPTPTPTPTPTVGQPCTINVYDADSRLPLSGSWDYNVIVQNGENVNGTATGAFEQVYLPATSIFQPHLLYVTKEGYEQTSPLAFDVPSGGREVKVYLTPLETTPPEGSLVVTFTVTDIETGTPRGSCLVNVDGMGKYAGASGTAWFVLPENSTHEWVVTAEGYWPIGGNFTLGVDDLSIPVGMTKKTSDLPRPPLPELPNFPVIHPSLDPAGFRMQILSVPLLGGLASPLLDTMDAIAVGLDDIAGPVLEFATAPADSVVEVLSEVGDQLTESVATYTDIVGVLLGAVGKLLAVFPALVVGLVSYNLVLDLVYLLLRGGL